MRGDRKTSRMAGRRIEEIGAARPVPRWARSFAACIARMAVPPTRMAKRRRSIIAHHDTVIEPLDHVIVFVPRKRSIRAVERLFQVSATFFG